MANPKAVEPTRRYARNRSPSATRGRADTCSSGPIPTPSLAIYASLPKRARQSPRPTSPERLYHCLVSLTHTRPFARTSSRTFSRDGKTSPYSVEVTWKTMKDGVCSSEPWTVGTSSFS